MRLYPPEERCGKGAEIDAAVLRLVRGLVPVPEVLEVRPARRQRTGRVLVTAFVEGVRGDELLPDPGPDGLARVGARSADLVADLGGMPMLRAGMFVDPDLTVEPWALDLPAYVADQRAAAGAPLRRRAGGAARGRGRGADAARHRPARLPRAQRPQPQEPAARPGRRSSSPRSSTGSSPTPATRSPTSATCSGSTAQPAFVEAVLEAYADRRGVPPEEALALARAADLFALVELATRRGQNPVADRAHDLLLAIAESGDLHAAAPQLQ